MRWTFLLVAVSLASCVTPSESPRREVLEEKPEEKKVSRPFRLAAMAGARSLLDTDTFDPVSDEFAAGVEFSRVGWNGFGFEFGVLGSTGFDREVGDLTVTAAVGEVFGGIRKEFDWGRWRPTFGVGGAFIGAGIDNDAGGVADDEDTTGGVYAHGGIIYDFKSKAFIGVDFRAMTDTSVDFGTFEGDVDYRQVTLILGVRL